MKIVPIPMFGPISGIIQCSAEHPFYADIQHAADFLSCYGNNTGTYTSYRREVERLLQWSFLIKKKSIRLLERNDFISYVEFCQNPLADWVAEHQAKRFIKTSMGDVVNPKWRPFVSDKNNRKGLSSKALEALFAITGSFFNFLKEINYVSINPVSGIKQKSQLIQRTAEKRVVRRLSEIQWSYMVEVAEKMAEKDINHERTLFVIKALFGMYLRISELTASSRWAPMMQHFFRDADGLWWFKTVGKGNKLRQISVSDEMLEALKRYRKSLGLSPLPAPDDKTPLIMSERTSLAISSTRQVRRIVENCFETAISKMRRDGFEDEAELLSQATVHWLRHTGISEDVKTRPREHVRDDAGHGSSAITDKYIDVELRARHESGKKKRLKPDL